MTPILVKPPDYSPRFRLESEKFDFSSEKKAERACQAEQSCANFSSAAPSNEELHTLYECGLILHFYSRHTHVIDWGIVVADVGF